MLLALRVSQLAVIDEVEIAFGSGLTVLTGETGAGKSILVEAISLLLGRRADPEVVRSGQDEASVEGVFAKGALLEERLRSFGLPDLGDEVCVRRVVARSGRSKAYVNGALVTVGVLAAVLRGVVDISGQHDQMSLFDRSLHRSLLDRMAGLGPLRQAYADELRGLKQLHSRADELGGSEQELQQRRDFLRFELDELERFSITAGEHERLEEERKRLLNLEKLRSALGHAEVLLSGEEGSIVECLRRVAALVSDAARLAPGLHASEAMLKGAFAEVEEASYALSRFAAGLQGDAQRLAEIEDRLDGARRLCRKHGCAIADLAGRREALADELQRHADRSQTLAALAEERKAAEEATRARGRILFEARHAAGGLLSRRVEDAIRLLGISGASFEVQVVESNRLECEGMDEVEFFFTANSGEPRRPLSEVASGGEASRVLLALKRALADSDQGSCYVLDEADAGLGGAAAEVVGRMIKEVSAHRQVLCVTHLAQVAAYADAHLLVVKLDQGGRCCSAVIPLEERPARARELARILSGVDVSKEAIGAAEALMRSAARAGRVRMQRAAATTTRRLRHSA